MFTDAVIVESSNASALLLALPTVPDLHHVACMFRKLRQPLLLLQFLGPSLRHAVTALAPAPILAVVTCRRMWRRRQPRHWRRQLAMLAYRSHVTAQLATARGAGFSSGVSLTVGSASACLRRSIFLVLGLEAFSGPIQLAVVSTSIAGAFCRRRIVRLDHLSVLPEMM
jgi:hypothetical protein